MNIKIMTKNVDEVSLKQIEDITSSEAFEGSTIRIMPDVHAGKGSVVGFTAKNPKYLIPNVIGVDIGCGVLVANLGKIEIDFEKLDKVINEKIPHGFAVREGDLIDPKMIEIASHLINSLNCHKYLSDIDRLANSLGTLGGGNHFIEIDEDDEDNKYLIIHTGSRNLGLQVANHYQEKAIKYQEQKRNIIPQTIEQLKKEGREKEIQSTIAELRKNIPTFNKDLAYLSEEDAKDYLKDLETSQIFAQANRSAILKTIVKEMGWETKEIFESIHNYYDKKDNTIRKGAIKANKGEKVIIPLNMRDGCIIALGKGNKDWNNSAPHGAGRIMSRNEARALLDLEDFEKTMEGIYSTSVNKDTIDEAPFAYKNSKDIINDITETVQIIKLLKPLYNFKSH